MLPRDSQEDRCDYWRSGRGRERAVRLVDRVLHENRDQRQTKTSRT